MRLRKSLAAAAGLLGGSAVLHRLQQRRVGSLESPLPGDQHTYRWRGMDVAYTEAGDRENDDLLLLHGVNAAATSHEWVAVIDDLADEYHVIAPDLPGFGRSDRPSIDYDAELYTDFVRDFGADVAPDAACVASSLTGSYAVLAQREAGVFSRLVLVCPTGRTLIRRSALRTLLRSPMVGTALFDLLSSKPSIRYSLTKMGVYDPAAVDESFVDYQWRSARQPGARFAPASFLGGALDSAEDLEDAIGTIDAPVTLVWGREAGFPPLDDGRRLAEAGDARLVVFDRARLLPHVEHPAEFVDAVHDALAPVEH